jgi:hypothetical protein
MTISVISTRDDATGRLSGLIPELADLGVSEVSGDRADAVTD